MTRVPIGHGTADLICSHPALVKPRREEVYPEYATPKHMGLHDV